jgi:hypothetical protein
LIPDRVSALSAAGERVFPTQEGGAMTSKVRNRILTKAVERANEHLAKSDATPLPEHLTHPSR